MTLSDQVDSYLEVTTCSLKALAYCIPLSLMLWGAFCYTQILSPTCDEILNPYVFPKSQTWSGNLLWISILLEKTQHHAYPLADERYLIQHHLCPVIEKQCNCAYALLLERFSPKPLCIKGKKAVPLVKMEKEKILEASRT